MGSQPMKPNGKPIFRGTRNRYDRNDNPRNQTRRRPPRIKNFFNNGKTTHETKHENDISRTKEPIQMGGQSMKIDTKTTSEIQGRITDHGKTTHETQPENDFSRDKESTRLKGQPTKTDTKTPFENQRDITNHGKTTHETKHENDFLRDK